jgi:hypothetical protein
MKKKIIDKKLSLSKTRLSNLNEVLSSQIQGGMGSEGKDCCKPVTTVASNSCPTVTTM